MRGEAETAERGDRLGNARLAAVLGRGLVDAEGEKMPSARGNLDSDQEQHIAVPALAAVVAGAERVVIREQDDVGLGRPRRFDDFVDRCRAVGVGRVQVEDAGEIVSLRRARRHNGSRARSGCR